MVLLMLFIDPLNPQRRMPNPYEPFIEENCPSSSSIAFWVPFGCNLGLMMVCFTIAFLTKSLPDNFHDSKCIFGSAAACSFIWVAFIPSLVTSTSGDTEDLLLSLAIGVSSFVILSSVFLPKIYGILTSKDVKIEFYTSSDSTRNRIQPN